MGTDISIAEKIKELELQLKVIETRKKIKELEGQLKQIETIKNADTGRSAPDKNADTGRADSDKSLLQFVKNNLAIRVVRPPADQKRCRGAVDGDLLAITYAGAYQVRSQSSEAEKLSEPALDLLDDAIAALDRWMVFDTSEQRARSVPFSLPLGNGNAINGLEIGLHGMCQGERRTIYVPPGLAYGRKGNKYFEIPPLAVLRFDVQLERLYEYGLGAEGSWQVPAQMVP